MWWGVQPWTPVCCIVLPTVAAAVTTGEQRDCLCQVWLIWFLLTSLYLGSSPCCCAHSPTPPPTPHPVILPPHTSVEGHTDFFCICLPPFNTHTHVSAGALLKRAREDEEHRQTDLHSCSCFSSSLRAVYTVGKKVHYVESTSGVVSADSSGVSFDIKPSGDHRHNSEACARGVCAH